MSELLLNNKLMLPSVSWKDIFRIIFHDFLSGESTMINLKKMETGTLT